MRSQDRRIKRLLPSVAVLALAVAAGSIAQEAPVEWVQRHEIQARRGHLSFRSRWDAARGLHLKLCRQAEGQTVVIDAAGQQGEIHVEPEKAFSPEIVKGTQFNVEALPAGNLDNARMVLKIGPRTWTLYVEDRPVVALPAPFAPPVTVFQRAADALPGTEGVRFQKTEEDIRFGENFSPTEESKNPLERWETISGNWRLHTAADTSIEREDIRPDAGDAARPQADFSPNFSCVEGKGTNAIIVSGYDHYDSYSLEGAVLAAPGEMGLVFHFPEGGGYHAFTVKMWENSNQVLYRLWTAPSATSQERKHIATVLSDLTSEQWIRLRVKTFQNRVQCFVDNIKVIDVPTELPAGGRFGFYLDRAAGTRFDDVQVKSNHDLDFRSVNDVRRYAVVENGEFFPRRRFFQLFPPKDTGNVFEVPKSKEEQWLIIGATEDGGHVCSASFEPALLPYCVGLITQYRGEKAPHLRFTCRRVENEEIFLLESVASKSTAVLEELRLPFAAGKQVPARVSLMCDVTNQREDQGNLVSAREVRCYRDGQLVLVHHMDSEPSGASGLYVGPQTKTKISDLAYYFEREDLYRNQFEKNRYYVEDPFMRHWSSPEGEWIESKSGMTWHKGDFFGRMLLRMPYIDKSEIHLGVGEVSTNGAVVIRALSDKLGIEEGSEPDGKRQARTSVPASALVSYVPEGKDEPRKWFTIHYEGYWLWLMSRDKLLVKHRLERPLEGSRVRIAGFTTDQLKHSYVERFNVKDWLFKESLHEWTVNGGEWDVVNRFQCQPRWSHMNGESPKGLAAMWSKYRFKGDFCVEMYAGIRHRWYETAGDLNLTVMGKTTSPSDGYTVTCTAWDPDRSQRYSRLYRNGEVLETSDKYLVPRNREGRMRKGYEPLVRPGRDLHGAWYYIKFRRIGKKLEYYFDNELVFSRADDHPLDDGTLGLWTFMDSMMVARVKTAARAIEPAGFAFTAVAPETAAPPGVSPTGNWQKYADLRKDDQLLELEVPANWEPADPVGRSRVSWHEKEGDSPFFVTTTVLGSGEMLTRCLLPPVPYDQVAGWRFYVKRTPGARFNFHYTVGALNNKGEYEAQFRYFHKISGDDFSKGAFRMCGQTEASPLPAGKTDWQSDGEWTLVQAWLPVRDLKYVPVGSNVLVKVEGFGNLAPSEIVQGLKGNGPGEGYAVKGFSEVRYTAPRMTLAEGTPFPRRVTVVDPNSGQALAVCTNIVQLQDWVKGAFDARDSQKEAHAVQFQEWVNSAANRGMTRVWLRADRDGFMSQNEVIWIRQPKEPEWACAWSEDKPGAIVFRSNSPYPDRRFCAAELSIAETKTPLITEDVGERWGLVPRKNGFLVSQLDPVPVRLTAPEGIVKTYSLAWNENRTREAPVLLKIDGSIPFFINFETREFPPALSADAKRMKLRHFDPEQGSFLQVANRGDPHRLTSSFHAPLDIARWPLLQFRYRGSGMVHVSLGVGGDHVVNLSEEYGQAKKVRYSGEFHTDGKWHTWVGMTSDSIDEGAFGAGFFQSGNYVFGSRNTVDQTGFFTEWEIDDLVAGPAISQNTQLTFTPSYFDLDGVKVVYMAVRKGPEPFHELKERDIKSLIWRSIPNGAASTPDLAGIAEGLCHLFLKAEDTQGNVSAVTDIPFILDKTPPKAGYAFEKTSRLTHNGTLLNITLATGGGAPASVKDLQLKWDDTPVTIEPMGSSMTHRPEQDVVSLNWPFIFRKMLDKSDNGQTHHIRLANIKDGAGNATPDLTIPAVIDYSKDSTPPTLLPAVYPSNVLWCATWDADRDVSSLVHSKNCTINVVAKPNEEPYLNIDVRKEQGEAAVSMAHRKWTVAAYPYVALRMRRPDMQKDDTNRISLVLSSGKETKRSILLAGPEKTDEKAIVCRDIAWESNVWHSATLDLRELLKGRLSDAEMKTWKIEGMAIALHTAREKASLHVQSLFVFAPWKPEDKVKLEAFDVSGVEGITWAYEAEVQGTELAPAALNVTRDNDRWILMRVRDKAGNLSAPLRIPMGPSAGAGGK